MQGGIFFYYFIYTDFTEQYIKHSLLLYLILYYAILFYMYLS